MLDPEPDEPEPTADPDEPEPIVEFEPLGVVELGLPSVEPVPAPLDPGAVEVEPLLLPELEPEPMVEPEPVLEPEPMLEPALPDPVIPDPDAPELDEPDKPVPDGLDFDVPFVVLFVPLAPDEPPMLLPALPELPDEPEPLWAKAVPATRSAAAATLRIIRIQNLLRYERRPP